MALCSNCEILRTDCPECCQCVPCSICIYTTIAGNQYCTCAGVLNSETDFLLDKYQNTLYCDDLEIDLTFTIERVDGTCYVVLSSDCLGLTESPSDDTRIFKEIVSVGNCENVAEGFISCRCMEADWGTFDLTDCGDANCTSITISTNKPDHVQMPRNPNAEGGSINCPLCFGMECFCRCLCIEWEAPSGNTYLEEDCFSCYAPGWETTINDGTDDIDVTITISADEYTKNCQLTATSSKGTVIQPTIEMIGTAHPSHRWEVTISDTDTAYISIKCLNCDVCQAPTVNNACCPAGIPEIVYATITDVASIPDSGGNCSTFEGMVVALRSNTTSGSGQVATTWNGTALILPRWCDEPVDPGGAGCCTEGSARINMTLHCEVDSNECADFVLDVEYEGISGSCIGTTDDQSIAQPYINCVCDPLSLEFATYELGDACGCCLEPFVPPNTFTRWTFKVIIED